MPGDRCHLDHDRTARAAVEGGAVAETSTRFTARTVSLGRFAGDGHSDAEQGEAARLREIDGLDPKTCKRDARS